jgi:hypothetical protein
MNRRNFLVGLASAIVAVHVPVKVIQTLVGSEPLQASVQGSLLKAYNNYVRGKGLGNLPRFIAVGESLFNAYEGELMFLQRFSHTANPTEKTLLFKGMAMYIDGPGWSYRFERERYA